MSRAYPSRLSKQLGVRVFALYLAERVVGVALADAAKLRVRDRKPTVALKAQAAHLESVPAASKVQDVLVRRNRRRNNENAVELQLVRDSGNKPYVPMCGGLKVPPKMPSRIYLSP